MFVLLGLIGLIGLNSGAAPTPVTGRMLDLTGSTLDRTITFTPLDGPLGFYGTNIVYGGPLTVQPVGGLAGFGRDEAIGLESGGALVAFTR